MRIINNSNCDLAEEFVSKMIAGRTGTIIKEVLGEVLVASTSDKRLKVTMTITPCVMEGPKQVEVTLDWNSGQVTEFCILP
jgi:hypothetical protein